jgi:hypothetical protein
MVAASSKAAPICAGATAMAGVGPTGAAAAAQRMRSLSWSCRGERAAVECSANGIAGRVLVRRGCHGSRCRVLSARNEK